MLLQQLINGLTIGWIYALIALGYSMVYGILKMVNFAHGDVLMIGTFLGFTMIVYMHVPVFIALPVAIILTGILGAVIERVAYRPLLHVDRIVPMISGMGVSILLSNLAKNLWGAGIHTFPPIYTNRVYNLSGSTVTSNQLIIIAISLSMMLILSVFVKKSRLGIAMRATSINLQHAKLMGINTNLVIALTFIIGSALAAVAGILIGVYYDAVYPTMGFSTGLKAFTAAVLGGIGSIPGAMLGGLILGIVENLGAAYISSQYQDIISFAVLVLVLLVRPTGIMGNNALEKV